MLLLSLETGLLIWKSLLPNSIRTGWKEIGKSTFSGTAVPAIRRLIRHPDYTWKSCISINWNSFLLWLLIEESFPCREAVAKPVCRKRILMVFFVRSERRLQRLRKGFGIKKQPLPRRIFLFLLRRGNFKSPAKFGWKKIVDELEMVVWAWLPSSFAEAMEDKPKTLHLQITTRIFCHFWRLLKLPQKSSGNNQKCLRTLGKLRSLCTKMLFQNFQVLQ